MYVAVAAVMVRGGDDASAILRHDSNRYTQLTWLSYPVDDSHFTTGRAEEHMTPEEFRQYWETTYPTCPPVGYVLRQRYSERWLRIHTLPASKRYAESEPEYHDILRRHNTVLTDTLGCGRTFVLVTTGYADSAIPASRPLEVAGHDLSSRHVLSIRMEDDVIPPYWHFFMDALHWEPGMGDPLLRQIADDMVRNVLFVSVERQCVYAPYDGGADIILPSASDRDALRHRYIDWLSAHPLGL